MFKPEEHIFKIKIITLSDRASKGEYSDRSGPEIQMLLEAFLSQTHWTANIEKTLIPDDAALLRTNLLHAFAQKADIVFTTGGTGIGPRDITIDVVTPLLHKQIPGIMEMVRVKYGSQKPAALLTRAVAGLHNNTFVFTLPGSVRAVNEYCTEIFSVLEHAFYMLYGLDKH
jgi:molybdenum cofactor synthesis domain-containing protein